MGKKRGWLIFWESISGMSWFDLIGWFSSQGIPEKEVERRYLAVAIIGVLMVGAISGSWWVFMHLNIVIATIACAAAWVAAFIVALWAVGRILPSKIHLGR